jgi:2'-hydroxyisoflavone reductase
MQILIIGGTRFLGRALVEAAIAGGHQLTLLHRGLTNPGLYPEVETLLGDRDGGLDILSGRTWDAVIDTCGYVPRIVHQSAEKLSDSAGLYVFISSLSVYADVSRPGLDETAPVGRLEDDAVEDVTGETYGPLKALCEQAVERAFPGRTLVIRPGLIVGPHDPTDRFTYWPQRIAQGGEVLAPGRPRRPIRFIDGRDLAEWVIRMAEKGQTGIYNADGPGVPQTMLDLLSTCRSVSGSSASFTWVDERLLLENKVEPWSDMPLWVPELDPESAGFFAIRSDKAVATGLVYRPVADTVQATLNWLERRSIDWEPRAGISRPREAELLAIWHNRSEGT